VGFLLIGASASAPAEATEYLVLHVKFEIETVRGAIRGRLTGDDSINLRRRSRYKTRRRGELRTATLDQLEQSMLIRAP
jgi:hypothetical protein